MPGEGGTELLCTFASLGWNECVTLDLVGALEVSAYVVPGEGLDVRLLLSTGNLQDVVGELGTISADALAEWDSINLIRVAFSDQPIADAIDRA